ARGTLPHRLRGQRALRRDAPGEEQRRARRARRDARRALRAKARDARRGAPAAVARRRNARRVMSVPEVVPGLSALAGVLERFGRRRGFVGTGPSERFLERVKPALGQREISVFSGARRHVPEGVLAEAERALAAFGADTVISVGGGSAVGLAKALRLA